MGTVERMFAIPYTDKKYIYIRHFSAPLLDSIIGVCYKQRYVCVRCEESEVIFRGDQLQMSVFRLPQLSLLSPNHS